MHRLRRFLAQTPADRRMLVRALGWVVLARAALWLIPFRRLREAAERLPRTGRAALEDPGRLAWAVETVARSVPRATCLTQALAADALLRRSGRSPHLRIGVARDAGALEAHAWIELDGRVLVGDHDLHRFTPLDGPSGV
jgi:hypothetical protein